MTIKKLALFAIIVASLLLTGCSQNSPATEVADSVPPTEAPTKEPTSTSTEVPTEVPTETPVPPTPTVAPPPILLDYLDGAIVTDVDTLDARAGWELYAGSISDGSLELIGNDWNGLMKQGSIAEGEGTIINFKYEKGSVFEVFYDYGQWYTDPYRRFGIYIFSGYPSANLFLGKNGLGFNRLHGNFQTKPDTWYSLLMAVDVEGEFLAVVWDPADPSRIISYNERAGEKWAGYDWDFRIGANEGTILFDDFMRITFDGIK